MFMFMLHQFGGKIQTFISHRLNILVYSMSRITWFHFLIRKVFPLRLNLKDQQASRWLDMLIITYSINMSRHVMLIMAGRHWEEAVFLKARRMKQSPAQFAHLYYLLQATQKVRINLSDACCSSRIHTHTCYCIYFNICYPWKWLFRTH